MPPIRENFLAFERRTTGIVLQQPAEWSEVLIRFTLIWMVFLGVPTAFREGAMVSVDVAYRSGGKVLKRALDIVIAIAALTLVAVMIRYGFDYSWRARFQTISGLESFSITWAYLAVPVGALFSVLGIVGALLDPRHRELETAQ